MTYNCKCVSVVDEPPGSFGDSNRNLLDTPRSYGGPTVRRTYADLACPACGGTGVAADASVDWREALMRLLDCLEEREGWTYEDDWGDYGISAGQKAAILVAYREHKKTKDDPPQEV